MNYDFDVIVIGAGAAGLTAAKTTAGFGKSVALIEKAKLGGSCTWTGCVPSKTLIKSAETAYFVNLFKKRGLQGTCKDIDSSYIMHHLRQTVERIYENHTPELLLKSGVEALFGSPKFLDSHHISLNGKTISFNKAIIATGSRPCIPKIEGIDSVNYVTNENFFSMEVLPKSMIILGGGPIGCEIASALNRLGVKVTIIEGCPQILSKGDLECVQIVADVMSEEGVTIKTNSIVKKVSQANNLIAIEYSDQLKKMHEATAESLFVATGRLGNSDQLGLESLGMRIQKTFIQTNKYLQTSISNIYACGDITGPYLFAHMAWHQAVAAAHNACNYFFKKKMDYHDLIWTTFTAPEIAALGLTELQARECYGDSIYVIKIPYAKFDRAIMDANEIGLGKFIYKKSGKLIGAHIVGERAGEIIGAVQFAKKAKMSLNTITNTILPYPTYVELFWKASKKMYVIKLLNNPFIRFMRTLFFKKIEKG
jgi:pyruvate/2-oxoglutarate dehydrogenase complex dihydrolipoamide dehydrogenase (E3) component